MKGLAGRALAVSVACLLPAAALLTLGCTGDLSSDSSGSLDDGSLSGELVSYVADFDDHVETRYFLRQSSGDERALDFVTPPRLEPGTRVRVWGTLAGERFAVKRLEKDSLQAQTSALIGAPAKPQRRWAFVLVNLGGGVNLTKEAAETKLFSLTPGSIRSYYREVSYGIQDLDGDVLGPFDFQPTTSCDTDSIVKAIKPMVTGTYSQYLWYFGSRVSGCGFAGLAAVGSAERPAANSWYNASSGCTVLVQEPGHNFGMQHSSSVRCTKGTTPVPMISAADADGTCTHNEYGNPYDPMGSGCYHMDGYQKAYQDWLTGCNVVKVSSSGTFTLFPLEKSCNGVQLLQIPLPAQRVLNFRASPSTIAATLTSYFLELRAPVGIDAKLTPRVLVTVGGDIREAKRTGGRNWLIDMSPETNVAGDVGLAAGRTYADPDPMGPKFTVVSADATKAVIRVELNGMPATETPGSGTCDDLTAFSAPGPDTCEATVVTGPPVDGGSVPNVADGGSGAPRDASSGMRLDASASPHLDGASASNFDVKAPLVSDATSGGGSPSPDAGASDVVDEEPVVSNGRVTGSCSCRVGARGPNDGFAVLLFASFFAVLTRRSRRR